MHIERPFQNRLDWALASLDLASIARGYTTLDAIAKKATVKIETAKAVSTGKYILMFSGAIAEVEESYVHALEIASSAVIDHVVLTSPHPELVRALSNNFHPLGCSLMIAEFYTVSSTLLAADVALKTCDLQLGSITLAQGIGAKGFFLAHGELCDVEAATSAIQNSVPSERIIAMETIANPHAEIAGFF